MDINELTIGQAKEISNMVSGNVVPSTTLNSMIGKDVIIRTYSAGVFFGELAEKSGEEVILKDARRMYYWKAKQGISLSACALYGVDDTSKIIEPVESIWLKAIEIIPCSETAINLLKGAEYVTAK